ncbi:MAG: lysylphosphatidylglycerol synthase transmembrane domain-containing protein [Gaiellaceae bacterium]
MRRAIWIVVSLASLGAVIWWASRQHAPKMPTNASGAGWLAASLGVYAVALALRGWRWHRIMRLAGIAHQRADAFWLMLVAYMGNTVLPARGGEVLRISILGSRTSAKVREVVGSVIAERVLDIATLAVIFAVLTWEGVAGSPTGTLAADLAAAALVAAAVLLVAYLALRRRGRFDSFATRVRPFAIASKLFIQPEGVPLAGVSGLIWVLEGLTLLFVGRSLGLHLTLLEALLTNVIASLFSALPAGPGYAGSYDAGILLGLHASRVMGGDAVGFLLLARFVVFVPVTIVGLIVLVTRYGGLRRKRGGKGVHLQDQYAENLLRS